MNLAFGEELFRYRGPAWYATTFEAPPGPSVRVRFEAVFLRSDVWVNGMLLWQDVDGTIHWNYHWLLPSEGGYYTLRTRATDGAGNVETPGAGITVYVVPQGEEPEFRVYLPLVLKN